MLSPTDLEELSQKSTCLICQAISKAVESYRKDLHVLKDLPASRIFVRNDGPSFLDNDYHFSPEIRYDIRDPSKLIIRAIMNLSITVPPETASGSDYESGLIVARPRLPNQKDASSPPDCDEPNFDEFQEIRVTPQYCLIYSPGERSELLGIEPWEVPYFDISLLLSWVRDCEIFHGDQCTDFVMSDIETCEFPILSCSRCQFFDDLIIA